MDLRGAYLDALGVERWVARHPVQQADSPWALLEAEVAACVGCVLHAGRTRTVFGSGNPHADWMIIGDAPDATEQAQGLPFVGPAGDLLTAMLRAIDLPREQVYLTNLLKCHPAGHGDSLTAEAAQCQPYLERQIALVQPRLLLAFGRRAAQQLLGSDAPLDGLRGRVHRVGAAQTPLVVTYHPAHLLSAPADKRKAWEDLQFARQSYRELAGAR